MDLNKIIIIFLGILFGYSLYLLISINNILVVPLNSLDNKQSKCIL